MSTKTRTLEGSNLQNNSDVIVVWIPVTRQILDDATQLDGWKLGKTSPEE